MDSFARGRKVCIIKVTDSKETQMSRTIRISKEFKFEMAHALDFHQGKCKNIHGHSYHLFVTVKGIVKSNTKDSDEGMVLDFSDLKSIVKGTIVDKLDHALLLASDSPFLNDALHATNTKLITVDFQPTCENMLSWFADEINSLLPKGVVLHKLLLRETPDSYAEWYGEDKL